MVSLVLASLVFVSAEAFALDCSKVKIETPSSPKWTEVKQYLSKHMKSNSIILRQLIWKNGWYVVEYDSNDFEPVINVLKKSSNGYIVKAGWGGMPEEGDSINDYLAERAKGVPPVLMKCFSPKGEPFANTLSK